MAVRSDRTAILAAGREGNCAGTVTYLSEGGVGAAGWNVATLR